MCVRVFVWVSACVSSCYQCHSCGAWSWQVGGEREEDGVSGVTRRPLQHGGSLCPSARASVGRKMWISSCKLGLPGNGLKAPVRPGRWENAQVVDAPAQVSRASQVCVCV